jgi:hypothetical protein
MNVTRTSIKSGITGEDAREFVKTGMTPREWQEVFPPEEGE